MARGHGRQGQQATQQRQRAQAPSVTSVVVQRLLQAGRPRAIKAQDRVQEESVGLAPGGNQKVGLRMASSRRTRAGRSSGEGKSHERRRGLKAGEKDPTGGTTRTLLSLLSCSIYRIHSRHRGSMMLKKGEAQKSTTGPTHRRPARRPESQGPPQRTSRKS